MNFNVSIIDQQVRGLTDRLRTQIEDEMAKTLDDTAARSAAFVVLWGIGFDGITPLYASTVADRFHGRNLGTIFGVLDLGFAAGAASGPWLTGYLFDRLGSYAPALWVILGTTVLAGLFLGLAAVPRARRN